VPAKLVEAERAIYKGQVKGKPANVVEKIVGGKLDKFYSTVCLLEQGFIKNPDQTMKELVSEQDRGAGREHRHSPLHPLSGWRKRRRAQRGSPRCLPKIHSRLSPLPLA
jgi:hypothetical protein